jgi:hypothetical protein
MTTPSQMPPVPTVLQEALNQLQSEYEADIVSVLQPILLANWREQRIQSYLDATGVGLIDYVRRVAQNYVRDAPLVASLQNGNASGAWEQLAPRLHQWAHQYLRNEAVEPAILPEAATQAARQAAHFILREHAPYDICFDTWALFQTHRACQEQSDRYRSRECGGELVTGRENSRRR